MSFYSLIFKDEEKAVNCFLCFSALSFLRDIISDIRCRNCDICLFLASVQCGCRYVSSSVLSDGIAFFPSSDESFMQYSFSDILLCQIISADSEVVLFRASLPFPAIVSISFGHQELYFHAFLTVAVLVDRKNSTFIGHTFPESFRNTSRVITGNVSEIFSLFCLHLHCI